ncbi:MAG TPA: SAM-dependent chlorinase/fluorinase [Candidatus Nanopelagicaceae bacterium]|jgi:S-adenosylmethionine hydrolase|nr:SAM-dependent chlorinase/fluorinase [Candidatus Nanopelagicaceae bacterium]
MEKLNNQIIGLITDFGARGQHYVASMKGIILNINPKASIIDIAHNITPFSIIEAAYIIKSTYSLYPKNTIFIIVVDPGVGSSREIIIIRTKSGYFFIGPNNGIFTNVFGSSEISKCIHIKNEQYFNTPVSNTFQGRDIMAPIGAYLSKGVDIDKFGSKFPIAKLINFPIELKKISDNEIRCTIQYIDEFGNLITNIKGNSVIFKEDTEIGIRTREQKIRGNFVKFFEEVFVNSLLFIVGSSGFLEISKNQGNAASDLGLKVGDIITVEL